MTATTNTARTRSMATATAAMALTVALAAPAVSDTDDTTATVRGQVTMAEPIEACVMVSAPDPLDFGILEFGASATSPSYALRSCSDGEQDLFGAGTDAMEQGGEGTWRLVGTTPGIDEYRINGSVSGVGSKQLGHDPTHVGILGSSQQTEAGHVLQTPPVGSVGAGATMEFQVTWIVTLADEADMTWTRQDSGTSQDLADIVFLDENFGWAVGDEVVLHTSDGGQAWRELAIPFRGSWSALSLHDADHAWIVGDNGMVIASRDGGGTWEQQAFPGDFFLSDVDFVDPDNGWIVGESGLVLATSDGGATWSEQDSGTSQDLNDIAFLDENLGWAVGDDVVVHTSDGGQTWREQSVPPEQRWIAISAVNADLAWIVSSEGTVAITHDGGSSWDQQTLIGFGHFATDAHFIDADRGWVAGEGVVFATVNGGQTWTSQSFPGDFFLAVTAVLTAAGQPIGWAAGAGGEIFVTGTSPQY